MCRFRLVPWAPIEYVTALCRTQQKHCKSTAKTNVLNASDDERSCEAERTSVDKNTCNALLRGFSSCTLEEPDDFELPAMLCFSNRKLFFEPGDFKLPTIATRLESDVPGTG